MTQTTPRQNPRTLLSALWVFFLMNIVFRDIHQFLSPGYMDWVIAGEMFGTKITDELMLFGGFAVEVIILMVILPHVLPRRALRVVNLLAVAFTAALILFTPPIDPDDVFFLLVGLATLATIAGFGWLRLAPIAVGSETLANATRIP